MALLREQITPTNLEEEIKSSYLDYSMSVIVSRALPDVRDGMKPVHRRILHAMNELHLYPNKPHKKSARLVGEVLGKYHPHGDIAVYESMVRMAQPWSLRYPLVDGQGNFGSMDGDGAAAMRYTETRMSRLALEMLKDIDKNTVDMRKNFDDSLDEPSVLPSGLPNLLVNGSSGIAVGMATNIPPHNLGEVINGIKALIQNPEISIDELMNHVPAPDFPTGGIIYGYNEVRNAYLTGRGKIIVRSKTYVEEAKNGKQSIIVTELPYQVNKAALISRVVDLVKDKTIEDITDIRDESDRDGVRVVIETKRDSIASVVLNNLFKHTQMQITFGAIMLALVDNRPKVCNLKEMMQYYIDHRNEVIVRRTQFDLDAAEERAHILEGLKIAVDNIDEVIKIIKSSRDPKIAGDRLIERFAFSERQTKAILEMRLQRLTGLEIEKIEIELRELRIIIEKYKEILASKELQLKIVADELDEVGRKFGDKRRTEIVRDNSEFKIEDLIANEEVIVTITHKGNIKRTPVSNYRRQNKGGRGASGAGTNDGDFIEHVFQASTHHFLLLFTDKGRCYKIKVYDLPEGSKNSKGRSIANVIPKQGDEIVNTYLPIKEFTDNNFIVLCTQSGTIKKMELSNFENTRSTGIIAINLHDDDKLMAARLSDGDCDIVLGTSGGIACRFRETDIRPMGRTAAGVKGITLAKDDKVVSMNIIKRFDSQLLIVGEKGYGKRTQYEEFRLTKRGAKGVISMNVTPKTGNVVGILTALDTDDLVVMTTKGIVIRQQMSDIRTIGRNTQGVRLIKLDEGDTIADITTVTRDMDPDEDDPEYQVPEVDDNQENLFEEK